MGWNGFGVQQIANSAEIDNQLRDGVFIYNRTVIVTTIWHTWANLFAFKWDNISELPHSLRNNLGQVIYGGVAKY